MRGNGRMVETLYHVGFGHDALNNELALLGIRDIFDLLGCPLLAEHRVERKVHRRHAAGANFGKQLIPFTNNNTRFHNQPPSNNTHRGYGNPIPRVSVG